MRVLLLGEYSNVHHTLGEALRRLGHEVLLISDGDGWKNYPRDIDLRRRFEGPFGSLIYLTQLLFLLPKLRGFDVVQLINPIFLQVKPRWNRWMLSYLKRHNRRMSLGCFGDDYYVVTRMQQPDFLEYTDFFADGKVIEHPVNQRRISNWTEKGRESVTRCSVEAAYSLLACLYEYYKVYDAEGFRHKLHYMPLPLAVSGMGEVRRSDLPLSGRKVRVLLAVQKLRGAMKGTDQIELLLQRLAKEHPDDIDLRRIESVPFEQYEKEVEAADVVVDQLYSYTPAMGALQAMSQGKVVISGFEPEYAKFLECLEDNETSVVAGIVNLRPFADEENYRILEETLLDRNKIAQLSVDSQAFVRKYHDADKVAALCVRIWGGE